jgi:hypothetical protein
MSRIGQDNEPVRVGIVCLYLYCRGRSNYQEVEDCDPINQPNLATCCGYPEPGPGFILANVVIQHLQCDE